jgi:hypothetical protein
MGITTQALNVILSEIKGKKIKNAAIFGRQTLHFSAEQFERIAAQHQFPLREISKRVRAQKNITRHAVRGNISDFQLFDMLGIENVDYFDISDYEGANVIEDLSRKLPKKYFSKYDFVYTGGCHDNVFSPATLLVNSSLLLRTGGVVVHYESFQGLMGAFTYLSPEWFYSYYSKNKFKGCNCYVMNHRKKSGTRFDYKVDVWGYKSDFTRDPMFDYLASSNAYSGILYTVVGAEKGADSSCESYPAQLQYLHRKSDDWRPWALSKFRAINELPLNSLVRSSAGARRVSLFNSDHYSYLGEL